MSGNTLEDAIRDALDGYCNTRVDELVVALAFAVNTYLGRESNEGEKSARREVASVAIEALLKQNCTGADDHDYHECRKCAGMQMELDAIVKEAQG